jgi:hypothetical protein
VLKLDREFLFESAECDEKDGFRTIIGLEWKCGSVVASALRLAFLHPALCISEYFFVGLEMPNLSLLFYIFAMASEITHYIYLLSGKKPGGN